MIKMLSRNNLSFYLSSIRSLEHWLHRWWYLYSAEHNVIPIQSLILPCCLSVLNPHFHLDLGSVPSINQPNSADDVQVRTKPLQGGVQSIVISMSVCLSVHWHVSKQTWPSFTGFSVHVNCGRGSVPFFGGAAIRYVEIFPVLWMASCFHTVGPIAHCGKNVACRNYRIDNRFQPDFVQR